MSHIPWAPSCRHEERDDFDRGIGVTACFVGGSSIDKAAEKQVPEVCKSKDKLAQQTPWAWLDGVARRLSRAHSPPARKRFPPYR